MRHVALCLLSLVVTAFAHADERAAVDWKALEAANLAARQQFSEKLPKLKTTRLFRIDPGATRSDAHPKLLRFHEWVVVASAAPSDASSEAKITRSLASIVASHDDGVAACFDPHHGLTLTDGRSTYDVLLCFECRRYIVYTSDGAVMYADSFKTRGEKKKWERVFNDAGLPGAKRN